MEGLSMNGPPTRPFWLLETRDFIAIILVAAMVGLMFALVLRPTAIPDTPVANIVIGGFMTVGFSAVIQFYFGSSKGSVTKDDTISTLTAAAAESAPIVVSPPAPVVMPGPSTRAPNVTPAPQSSSVGLSGR
jgi:hypothetical protein